MEPEPGAPRRLDLMAIALLVFFVSVMAIVAALLILPTLTG
ncbi:MAG: hypothetical protein WD402_10495 [Chloroflexota bacterium]